jgi:CubicO group peptidase (beta-lactamase class C family)
MTITLPAVAELRERLHELATKYRVPGAVAGILADGEVTVCATGVTRLGDEGAPITPDTLFQIGSITKVWTATIIMQLADEGRLSLDDPVNRHLDPPLRLADKNVADSVTVHQLLSHTGGFYGDTDDPAERGDDAVKRAVASYAELPQLHRQGSMFSYSNAGYNVLGRVIECLTGSTWDEALRERIVTPLGLERAFTLPEHMMVHRVAVGHEKLAGSDKLTPVPVWMPGNARSQGPCGGTLTCRAADLLGFARMHLNDGRGPDGRQVLSAGSARLMRQPQVDVIDPLLLAEAWGLGWEVNRTADPVVVGHGGDTEGQHAQLYLVPDTGVAVCLLDNGEDGPLREELLGELLGGMGINMPSRPQPARDGSLPDLAPFLGTYGRKDIRFTFRRAQGGDLETECITGGEIEKYVPDFTVTLPYSSGSMFLLPLPGQEEHPASVTFVREDAGEGPATHIALGGRVLPRLAADGTRS